MRILLVEERPAGTPRLAPQLRAAGHDVLEAHDCDAAVGMLGTVPLDVLLADLRIPCLPAFRLCLHVRDTLKLDLPIVFLAAGSASAADLQLGVRLGADACIARPASGDTVDAALREARDMRRRASQYPAHADTSETAAQSGECAVQDDAVLRHAAVALDATSDAVFLFHSGTLRLAFANRGAVAQTGYGLHELLAMTPLALQPEIDEPRYRAMLAPLLTGARESHTLVTVHRRKDGTTLPVEVLLQRARESNGEALVVAVARDIGERSLALEALAETGRRLALATDSAHIGIWDWDVAADRMSWDVQTHALYGTRAESFGGDYDAWQRALHPGDRARVAAECAAALSGTRAFDSEFRVVGPDGQVREVELHGRVQRDAGGAPQRVIGVNWDTTVRKRAQEALNRDNALLEQRVVERTAQLRQAVMELESFAYSVSHDLRAPLRAIDGFASLLATDHAPELSAAASGYLDLIRSAAQQMGALIRDLLAFARLGRQALRREIVMPEVLVRECLELLRPELDGREVRLDIGALPACEGDAGLLKLVWLNLLSNALKYTRRTPDAQIEVGCRDVDGDAVYFVRDNGVGFSMAYADKLFGMFQRLHRSEDYEGTGVGLASAQRIVQRHGGRIWADGALNRGATFSFTLPREAPT
jgi:PAS domain S-box-containing protein